MIARTWRGVVRREDANEYAAYMRRTGIPGYAETPGNRGALMLRRDLDEEHAEFVMLSLWESLDAVKAFAGDDLVQAVFYPEDEDFLVEADPICDHFVVEEAVTPHDGPTPTD